MAPGLERPLQAAEPGAGPAKPDERREEKEKGQAAAGP